MIDGWKEIRLGDVGTVITGKTPKTNNELNFGFDYLFITPRDFNGEKYITKTERMVSTSGLSSIKSSELQECSICITCIGSNMGEVAMIKTKAVTNQQINSISNIDIKLFYPDYVYYALKGYKKYFKRITGGSALPILNKNYFSDVKISLPPLPEQKSIAFIFSSLDSKIENLRQQNQTLEKIAQTLFKHWFVDFEYHNEQGKPYKSSGGKFIDSDLGPIPEGWRIFEFRELIKFIKGKKPKETLLSKKENYLPQILINTFDGGTSLYALNKNVVLADESDLIMVMDGASSGRIEFGYNGIIGSTLSLLEIEKNIKSLLYFFLKNMEKDIKENTTGSAIPHTDKERVYNYTITLPKSGLYNFEDIFNTFRKKIIFNRSQIQILTKTRDTLLPKLMSGEIRI
ncbi:MAG: restriction endonuclease subunit S [Candidatus Cloacimonetes bacterium]|nr:restriction endonuclease subunit S [Candidatus Cloacimonadota bacterium]